MTIRNREKAIWALPEALAVMIALQALKGLLEYLAAPYLPATRFADKMLTMMVMLLLTPVVIGYARLRRTPLSAFPERFSRGYFLATAVAAGLMIATPSNYTGGLPAILVLIYGSIVTPVYEELLFRGWLWNRLESVCRGKYAACLVTAALFGLWHIGYIIPQLIAGNWFAVSTKVAVGLIYGLILGLLRQKSGNCYATILLHGIMNLFAF